MKETINANIGQQVFTLDRDAYDRLSLYLDEIRKHIVTDTEEIVGDIEIRIAEILREELPSSMMVVTLSMVERVIQQIGAPEDFAAESNNETKNINNKENRHMKQLRRSRSDRSIAGVCGGVAKYLGVDSTVLRIATFLLIFFGGMSLWVYIILWLLIPEE